MWRPDPWLQAPGPVTSCGSGLGGGGRQGRAKVPGCSFPPHTPPHLMEARLCQAAQPTAQRPLAGPGSLQRLRQVRRLRWVGRGAVMCKLVAEGEVGLGGECGGRASRCRRKAFWGSGPQRGHRLALRSVFGMGSRRPPGLCLLITSFLSPSAPRELPNGSALSLLLLPVTPLGRRGQPGYHLPWAGRAFPEPRSLCVAEPSAGGSVGSRLAPNLHRAWEGRGPEAAPVTGQSQGKQACAGRPEPQAPVPGLPGTLQLLGSRAGPPSWSGKISSQALLLPTGESRLPRPGLCPHITGAGTQRVPVAVGRRVAEAVHVLVEGGGHAVGLEHAEEGVSTAAQQQADQLVVP